MNLLKQFQGIEGKRRVLTILRNNEIVKHDNGLAQRFAEIVELSEYEKGQNLYMQGENAKGYLYFILSGKIDLLRNGKFITRRETGHVVGEFPFILPNFSYTVISSCQERTVVAKVSEKQFQLIPEDYPLLWRTMSEILVVKLNTTTDLLSGSKSSRVFIGHGHSDLWRELKDFIVEKLHLEYDEFNREPTAGMSTTDRLSEMLHTAGLAFLVFTAEDEHSSGKVSARMNVIHEAGLFQGRIGFKKAIILIEEGTEEFSNIYGLGQIRFPLGNIKSIFENVREVITREGLLN